MDLSALKIVFSRRGSVLLLACASLIGRPWVSTWEHWDIFFDIIHKSPLMFSPSTVAKVLTLTLLASYVRILIQSYGSPLGDIQGPLPARVTRFWKLWKTYRGSFQQATIELHKKHGRIVRIAPNIYSISDPKAIRTILCDPRYKKSGWYSAADQSAPENQDVFSLEIPEQSTDLSHQMNLVPKKPVQGMESAVDECISEFCERLCQASDEHITIDLFSEIQCLIFKTATAVRRAEGMEPRENIRDLRDSIFSSAFRHLLWLKAAVNLVRDFGRRPAWVISNFIDREISDRFGGPLVYSNDMLSRLLDLHNEDPTRSPLAPVKNGSLIVPGFDIVSNVCSKILDELCRKPHLMVELRKEIDSCVNSLEPKWTLSSRQLKQMGYLAAVTHEAIRIHPAAGFPLEAIVPDAGALIMGRYFPRKAAVSINTWAVNRDEDVFGEDTDDFRPERWLKSDTQAGRMKAQLFLWGDESQFWSEKTLAIITIQKTVTCLTQHFTLSLEHPKQRLDPINCQYVEPKSILVTISKRLMSPPKT